MIITEYLRIVFFFFLRFFLNLFCERGKARKRENGAYSCVHVCVFGCVCVYVMRFAHKFFFSFFVSKLGISKLLNDYSLERLKLFEEYEVKYCEYEGSLILRANR